jgi:hypothetical protein
MDADVYANVMQLSPQLDRHEEPAVVKEPAEQAPHSAPWLLAQQRVKARHLTISSNGGRLAVVPGHRPSGLRALS